MTIPEQVDAYRALLDEKDRLRFSFLAISHFTRISVPYERP